MQLRSSDCKPVHALSVCITRILMNSKHGHIQGLGVCILDQGLLACCPVPVFV